MEQTLYAMIQKIDEEGKLEVDVTLFLEKADAKRILHEKVKETIQAGAMIIEDTHEQIVVEMGYYHPCNYQVFSIEEVQVPFLVKKKEQVQVVAKVEEAAISNRQTPSIFVVGKKEEEKKAFAKVKEIAEELLLRGFSLEEKFEQTCMQARKKATYFHRLGTQLILSRQIGKVQ